MGARVATRARESVGYAARAQTRYIGDDTPKCISWCYFKVCFWASRFSNSLTAETVHSSTEPFNASKVLSSCAETHISFSQRTQSVDNMLAYGWRQNPTVFDVSGSQD